MVDDDVPNPDPLGSDVAELAKDSGISVDEARAALEIQPDVGRMEAVLEKALPASYGGAVIEYQPEYGVTILVEPDHADRVANAIEQRGFGHLWPYITLRETRYTRPTLLEAVARVEQISEGRVTSTDIDLRAGDVVVSAATDEDVARIREAVERNRSSIEALDVVVVRTPGGGEESSPGWSQLGCQNQLMPVESMRWGSAWSSLTTGITQLLSGRDYGERRTMRAIPGLMVLVLVAVLGGCEPGPETPDVASPTPSVTATNQASPDLVFPVQETASGMESRTHGTLIRQRTLPPRAGPQVQGPDPAFLASRLDLRAAGWRYRRSERRCRCWARWRTVGARRWDPGSGPSSESARRSRRLSRHVLARFDHRALTKSERCDR